MTDKLTADELKALREKATKGPWSQSPDTCAGSVWVSAHGQPMLEPGFSWRNLARGTFRLFVRDTWDWRVPFEMRTRRECVQREHDAALIVALVNAAPELERALRVMEAVQEDWDAKALRTFAKNHLPTQAPGCTDGAAELFVKLAAALEDSCPRT